MKGYKAIGYNDGARMTRLLSGPTQEKPFMTKKEIASKIAKQFEITQLLALEAVQMVFDGIVETLVGEGRIELRNFGVFEVRRRRARKARNPRTGERVFVPARLVVTFKPGLEMEQRVNELKGRMKAGVDG